MNGSPELLEFYLVEATEYLDALDQLVAGTGGAPDGNAFIATARALRGASSMAKVNEVGEIAAIVEQIAHGTRDGEIRWTLDLHATLKGTVDDLRFLVRGVRIWGERESARAQARLADLQRFLSPAQSRQPTPEASATAPVFIALQSSAIAAELDAFIANPQQRRALDDALTRVRTMRGIAGIGDFPPLADVADAVDRAARALMPDAPLAAREIELFRSAAEVLRRSSARLRDGIPQPADAPEVARFAAAAEALADERPPVEGDPIVPIDRLFYNDGGPHVVQRAVAPPTTPFGRFQEEIITRAEHIRRLVGDARAAQDPAGRERSARVLREALLELQGTAASFDVHQVASFFGEAAREDDLRSPSLLEAVDAGAMLLLTPGGSAHEIEQRLAVLERARRVTAIMSPAIEETPIAPPVSPRIEAPTTTAAQTQRAPHASAPPAPVAPAAPAPVSTSSASPATPPAPAVATPVSEPSIDELLDLEDEGPFAPTTESAPRPTPERSSTQEILAALDLTPAPAKPAASPSAGTPPSPPPSTFPRPVAPRRSPATPSGRELQTLLQEGIAGLGTLEDEPLSAPARLDEDDIVPIESLVYRGQSAIRRAIAVRDEMRASGRTDDATLQEIFDLLDLAQAE